MIPKVTASTMFLPPEYCVSITRTSYVTCVQTSSEYRELGFQRIYRRVCINGFILFRAHLLVNICLINVYMADFRSKTDFHYTLLTNL